MSQIYDHQLEPYSLTITQYGLLSHLKSFDGIGVGALAAKLVMDPTTLTRNLRPLERRGYVSLGRDPKDRRNRTLHLTSEGRAIREEAKPGWQAAQEKVAKALGAPDNAMLAATIDRLIEELND
ncbi:MarR family winged helix-turn-helix transcriptional regulator [Sneathiella sp.]|uniref:MarR family winged helix-turn-helix transcriptional regulator n=1 Tax=Sneathiella sp. TaxID=1964365 RepID=UPI003566521F